ncbi:MAG: hydroxymethylglutaryl-CoA lyase [Desulfobacterales bacterium]|nr:hydroxymethylglutaryl-CoA lyase [Desulfobacterales bacterium]
MQTENKWPQAVTLTDVGLRDGIQIENRLVPTAMKLELIAALVTAGVKYLQITAFVHPEKVPQMADAEKLVSLLPAYTGVEFSGLVLNTTGVLRARDTGLKCVEVSVSASDTHSRKNAGLSLERAESMAIEMVTLAKENGLQVKAGIQCAFGCVYEGEVSEERVLQMAAAYARAGADRLALADTTGMGTPVSVEKILTMIAPVVGELPLALHLHDTRGLGLVNLLKAMELGVSLFDTSFGGMGGCPFVSGAAGNIATEDTVHLLTSLDIETGIDLGKVAHCSRRMAQFLGKALPGKLYRLKA